MKKGFTLIELMAVVVIISLVCLLTFPNIVNQIKKSKDANKDNVEKVVISAAKKYVNDNIDKYSEDGQYCISVQDLINNDYLKEDIVNDEDNKYQKYFINFIQNKYELKSNCDIKSYKIGDEVTYNNIKFHVIEDSDINKNSVTLLKSEPLTVAEVEKYGENHINVYTPNNTGTVVNIKGYGGVAYYSSANCGINSEGVYVVNNCVTDFAQSDIKFILDNYLVQFNTKDLLIDNTGFKIRLITREELIKLGYENTDKPSYWVDNKYKYDWLYIKEQGGFWTMSKKNSNDVWHVNINGTLSYGTRVCGGYMTIRPVITIKKVAII